MKKLTKIIIWISVIYLILLGFLIYLIYHYKWSLWVLFWAILVPVLLFGGGFLLYKLLSRGYKKEEIEEEVPDVPIDEQKSYINSWIKSNEFYPVDEPIIEDIRPYTPRQEGLNKLTVNIARVKGYWDKNLDGFDILYLATQRKKKEIIMHKQYPIEEENKAERDFEQLVDKAVLNPVQSIETEELIADPMTGQSRVVKKKVPATYLKQAQEEKETKKNEEEEGVNDED